LNVKILVIGGGIAGLSTAWQGLRRGHDVVLIEQGDIPNSFGASGDHHRIIRRAYDPESGYAGLITDAFSAWRDLWADLGENHLDARGFMCISRKDGDEAERYRAGMDAGGFSYELLGPAEAARDYPFLDPSAIRYLFRSPEGGALHCRAIARSMAEWLRANGADLRERTQAIAVDPDNALATLESGETLEADAVVVAAGAWVLRLFPELSSTLTTYRTAVAYLQPPPEHAEAWARSPTILDVGGDTDGYIIPPSGDGGLKFGSGLHKELTDDANADRAARPGEGEIIRDLFAPPLRNLDRYRVTDVRSCVYTFTSNERFFARSIGRALVVSACSGHGYKFGSAVGQRVVAALEEESDARLVAWLSGQRT
jgi:sarcosine oxidase